jgi:RNA polymerase sigma-70 factor, ECF subfamily
VLVGLLRTGNDQAFGLVLDAWSGGMVRLARGFVTTEASAAEVVQDTWLAVVEGIDRFEGRSSLKTWVYRILLNTARRRREREGRAIPWSSLASEDEGPTVDPSRFQRAGEPYPGHWREFPAPWPSPEQGALSAEIREQVAAGLAELPERQRIVVILRDVEGYDSDEVCVILGISAANQRVLLHRGRALLRRRLEEYFATVVSEEDGPA